jgi:phosphocarrier protein HPr
MSDGTTESVSETVQIVNNRGLHARASAKFVNMVAMLPDTLKVEVRKDGAEAAGGSILGLMMLGAAKGDSIEIEVTGEGCEGALAKLCGLVKDGFGED